MKLPVLIAAGGAAWEADLVAALERGSAAVAVARRCVDIVDLRYGWSASRAVSRASIWLRWLAVLRNVLREWWRSESRPLRISCSTLTRMISRHVAVSPSETARSETIKVVRMRHCFIASQSLRVSP